MKTIQIPEPGDVVRWVLNPGHFANVLSKPHVVTRVGDVQRGAVVEVEMDDG